MAFDVQGALKDGYSPAEIADYLASKRNFDVDSARKDGVSDDEIISHLTGRVEAPKAAPVEAAPAVAPTPLPVGVAPSGGRSATPMGKPDPRLAPGFNLSSKPEKGFIAGAMAEPTYLGAALERGWKSINASINGAKMAEYGDLIESFNRTYSAEQIAADPALQKEKLARETAFAKLAQENAALSKESDAILKSDRTRPTTKLMFGVDSKSKGWLDTATEVGKAIIQDPGSVVDLALSSGPSTLASLAAATATYLGTRSPTAAAAAD